MIKNLHALRAVAALMVVYVHIVPNLRRAYEDLPIFVSANAGVDIFFVLSGFLMVTSTEKSQTTILEFYFNRMARIVPLYWLLNLLICTTYFLGLKPIGVISLQLDSVLKSFLFLPVHRNGVDYPILYVGWTLIYEIFFYLLFGFFVQMKYRIYASIFVTLIVTILGGLPLVLNVGDSVFARFYTNPIMLDFALGVWLAHLSLAYDFRRLPAYSLISSALAGGLLVAIPDIISLPSFEGFIRPATWGLGGSLIIFTLIGVEKRGLYLNYSPVITIGSASYAIYLIHPFVLQIVEKVTSPVVEYPLIYAVLTVLSGLGLTILISAVVWRRFEIPANKALRNWYTARTLRIHSNAV
ncbi:acyltransferase [Agrobacterium tumefaciens]|uniref:acyltransferase family protein n=1 Tax=Agrobacterium TaxID=357 RepID=UPI00115C9916|nr:MULTISPECIES: acyltransferase [Agrobacterium]MDA5244834.1 acyltransferase [Agrobacterium sp. MAFF310724]MDA5246738.1 acyltransferase [Agrobacterium sp. MAFF210268]TRB17843.1 acyltransferase [Agrobacterium tumefaciens]